MRRATEFNSNFKGVELGMYVLLFGDVRGALFCYINALQCQCFLLYCTLVQCSVV